MSGKGHNKPPRRKTFRRAWADAILSDPNVPTGAVAVAWKMVHEMDRDGCGIAASDAALMAASGLSERALRNFKKWLVDAGYIRVFAKAKRTSPTIYQGLLPASDAANNAQVDRHHMPPAPRAANSVSPAPDAAPRAANKPAHIEEHAGARAQAQKEFNKLNTLSQERGADAPPSLGPHMNGKGFIICAERGLVIPPQIIDQWKIKYPNIADLEALLQKLSMHMLNSGNWLKFREHPWFYFQPMLAENDAQAKARKPAKKKQGLTRWN